MKAAKERTIISSGPPRESEQQKVFGRQVTRDSEQHEEFSRQVTRDSETHKTLSRQTSIGQVPTEPNREKNKGSRRRSFERAVFRQSLTRPLEPSATRVSNDLDNELKVPRPNLTCERCGAEISMITTPDYTLCWGCGATLRDSKSKDNEKFNGVLSESQNRARSELKTAAVRKPGSEVERTVTKEKMAAMPLFVASQPGFIEALVPWMNFRKIREGTAVISRHATCNTLLIVLRGQLSCRVGDVSIFTVEAGQHLGTTHLLGLDDLSPLTVVTDMHTTLCELHKKDFWLVLKDFPEDRRRFNLILKKNVRVDIMTAGTLVRPCHVFSTLSDRVIRYIDDHLIRRIYFPGEILLKEGTQGDELYILARGCLSIEIAGRQVRIEKSDPIPTDDEKNTISSSLQSTSYVSSVDESNKDDQQPTICVGELGLFGLQEVRAATVITKTVCHMRCLFRQIFDQALGANNEGEKMLGMIDEVSNRYAENGNNLRASNVANLKKVKMFQEAGCSTEFLDFLSGHLEERVFLPGATIMRENEQDDGCMYILSIGQARVLKNDMHVARLNPGAVLGEVTVLGLASKRNATIIADQTCCMQALHRNVLVRGLELFRSERAKILMAAFHRSDKVNKIDADNFREASKDQNAEDDGAALFNTLKQHSLFFAQMGEKCPLFLSEIKAVARDRIFMPGESVVLEGQRGDSMFIVISGRLTIRSSVGKNEGAAEVHAKPQQGGSLVPDAVNGSIVGSISSGGIAGELAMLGVAPIRMATLIADSICLLWEINQETGLALLQRFPEADQHFSNLIVGHLEPSINPRISSLPFFRKFDIKFKTFLACDCTRKALFPGSVFAKEGKPGHTFFIINLGVAVIQKLGETIQTLPPGSSYGATSMLGVHKTYFATLGVLRTCHVLCVTSASFFAAIEQYPSTVALRMLQKQMVNAERKLREDILRVAVRKHMWKRYQNGDPVVSMSDDDLRRAALHAWIQVAKRMANRRRAQEETLEKYSSRLRSWVDGRNEAKARAEQRRRERFRCSNDSDTEDKTPKENREWTEANITQSNKYAGAAHFLPSLSDSTAERFKAVEHAMIEWPKPKQSPFYRLKYTRILHEVAQSSDVAGVVLPVIQSTATSRCAIRASSDFEQSEAGIDCELS